MADLVHTSVNARESKIDSQEDADKVPERTSDTSGQLRDRDRRRLMLNVQTKKHTWAGTHLAVILGRKLWSRMGWQVVWDEQWKRSSVAGMGNK